MIKIGTWKAEPASEDGWFDDEISEPEAFDILFGYAEERHRNNPCAHPVSFNGEGI